MIGDEGVCPGNQEIRYTFVPSYKLGDPRPIVIPVRSKTRHDELSLRNINNPVNWYVMHKHHVNRRQHGYIYMSRD